MAEPVTTGSAAPAKTTKTSSKAAVSPVASEPTTIRPIWPLRVAGAVVRVSVMSLVLPAPWLGWPGVGTEESSARVCSALLMLAPPGELLASIRLSLRRPVQARLREITGIWAQPEDRLQGWID